MNITLIAALAATTLVVTSIPSEARFDCGRTVKHLTHSSCGSNLARAWAVACPHTYLHAGAVVVTSRSGMDSSGRHHGGHVVLVIRTIDACNAVVRDEKGTYERDVCRNQIAIVEPNG